MPKKNIGYTQAINLAKSQLEIKNPNTVIQNTKTIWNGISYEIPWFNKIIELEKGDVAEQIIWLHYLNASGSKTLSNNYISYKQVPGGSIYNNNFTKRCLNPLLKKFSNDLEGFKKVGKLLDGKIENLGHASITLYPLPYIPITFVIWQGDDEIPSNGNILYDETISDWFCAEDVVVLTEQCIYKLISVNK